MDIVILIFISMICGLGIGVLFSQLMHHAQAKLKKYTRQVIPSKNIAEELTIAKQNEQLLRDEVHLLQMKLQQAFVDPITNLNSWQLFEDRLNRSIKESERLQLPLAILFVDIDDFKVINDGLNHEVGNHLLRQVAARLLTCVRQVDSVCRFTKDTYVVMLTQLTKPETAAVVAQRIMQSLMEPFTINDHELSITVGIGIAIYPNDAKNGSALLRSADHAMHLAKEKGRHIYQFYQEKMHAQSQRDLAIYNSFTRDSIFNEFTLYYSPIMSIEQNSILCMEVLLHWHHPSLGLISYEELYTYAEKQHKHNLVSEWLLQNACKQFLHWQELGFKPEYISLPISCHQLENTHFIYRVSQMLKELNFPAQSLILQIKEKSPKISYESLEKAINMLKYLGVKIMIDDFGNGLFPMYHLKDFPVSFIKLAEAITRDLEINANSSVLLQSLLALAHDLNIELVAQGITTESQKNKLQQLGCKSMQGAYFNQPLTEQEVTAKLFS